MGTTIEGELEWLPALVRKMHQAVLDSGVMRVIAAINVDDHRGKIASQNTKVESLKKALGH